MSIYDYLLIALLVIWAAASFAYMHRRKKKCSGCCQGCSGCCAECGAKK